MKQASAKKNFAIIHLGSIGDSIMASPLASAIKQQHPDAWITWVTTPSCKDLLNDNPCIDKVVVANYAKWKESLKQLNPRSLLQELSQFKAELRCKPYEYALDLQGILKSGLAANLSNAKHKIGLGSREGSNWLMTKTISRNLGDTTQIGSEYRYLANQLGFSDNTWPMQPHTTAEAIDTAEKTLNNKNLSLNDKYIVICPHTTERENRWPKSYWQQICLRIRGRHHLRAVILGEGQQTKLTADLERHGGAIDLTGKCSTAEAAIIIDHAKLIIGIDTGLTHLGHAYQTPTLALFGPTHPYSHTGLETSKILHLDLNCSPCLGNPTCNGKYECMSTITPDTVLSQIKTLLRNKK
ncbi:glycosyltransferase family 9 protein [Saccharophagus degradans]|uniref:Glycosyltransferase family 9 protein n=1 Tax=Saccharophagus degradans TaxID=86304 RepID=A0AAW7XEC7_9GAMM|nr:glycosyltransferase family 9 protein [Saccharophagus degradans]MDO6424916.1 glycosyltransferase family 9 protein [Saccharophagus degradans]MDO6609786.1 glycosyltransferase family 9 protein [Saccharophagus degradans]